MPRSDSGNEYIRRSHPAARWLHLIGLGLAAIAVLWLNLAVIAAARWPARTVLESLFIPFQFGRMRTIAAALFNVSAAMSGLNLNPWTHPPATPAHLWWLSWWAFARAHAVGAHLHLFGASPLAWALTVDLAIAVAAWLPFARWAHRLDRGQQPDRRPGTAQWASRQDLRLFQTAARRDPGALYIGSVAPGMPAAGLDLAIPFSHRSGHIEVLGVTGSGKTGCLFKPWIVHDALLNDADRAGHAISTVVIDVKHPDIYDAVAPFISPLPRPLLVLAPDHGHTTMHYNPLDALDPRYADSYLGEIQTLTYTIVENTVLAERDIPYHRSLETHLLETLIQFVYEAERARTPLDPAYVNGIFRPFLEPGQRLPRVGSLSFIALLARLPQKSFLEFVSKTITDSQEPTKWASRIAQEAERGKGDLVGTLEGLQRRLAAFAAPNVARVTQRSDFRLDTIARRPTTLIIGTPSGGEAAQTFAALMITQIVHHVLQVAKRSHERRLPVPVMIYLDEVINQARIPGLEDHIATLREVGCWFAVGLQDYSGLEQRYGDKAAQKLLNNLRTKIVLGTDINPYQAERAVIPALGDTTIITHSTSAGERGASESQHVSSRPLKTVDQVRQMKLGQALVFLQGGLRTEVRLPLMPRRDLTTGRWHPASLRRGEFGRLCAPLIRWLDQLAQDSRLAEPQRTALRDQGVNDAMILKGRLDQLGETLHVSPGTGDGQGSAGPNGAGQRTGGSPVLGADPAHDPFKSLYTSKLGAANGDSPPSPEARSEEIAATVRTPDPEPAPTVHREATNTTEPPAVTTPDGSGSARPVPTVSPAGPNPDRVMDEIRGFYNALLTHCNLGLSVSVTPGWRIAGDPGAVLAVYTEVLAAYAERRSTKLDRMLNQWVATGFARPGQTHVTIGKTRIPVVVLTPLALRTERVAPVLRDKIALWPEVRSDQLSGGTPSARPTTQRTVTATPAADDAAAGQRPVPQRAADPDTVLQHVVQWIREHEAQLHHPGQDPIGQWEAMLGDQLVLLIRGRDAARLLARHTTDARAVQQAWKDAGIITAPGSPSEAQRNRFTVYASADGKMETRTRYLALKWTALEAVGLLRDGHQKQAVEVS